MHASRTFPLHHPLRKFDRDAPVAQMLLPGEKRPVGWGPLWPYIYRFYDVDRRPLYIGITSCSALRFDGHRKQAEWWPLVEYIAISVYARHDDIREFERAAIRNEQPRFNRQGLRGVATAKVPLHGAPEAAAAVLFREAEPGFITALAALLMQPERFPQPEPPPPARFADEEAP